MSKATASKARRIVERLGGTLTNEGGGSWNADAPAGHTWDGDLHCYAVDTSFDAPHAWADLIDRISGGDHMEKCTGENENCRFTGCPSTLKPEEKPTATDLPELDAFFL